MFYPYVLSRRVISHFVILLCLCSFPIYAQSGVIRGTVLDPTGATVGKATITAVDQAKGLAVRVAYSEPNGEFQLSPLGPGTYSVKAEASGFKSAERKGLVLDVNQIMSLEPIRLEVGTISESVVVDAAPPQVETASADRNFVVTSKEVTEQSLNGRDWQSLLRTLPGIVSNDSSDFRLAFNNTDSFNVNGLRGSNNNVFLDGSINTDVGANDGQYTQLSLDAVSEFKVQTSVFNAEYGRSPGVLISAITKSGSNQFHGTAYEFVRNSAFDANSFFNNLQGAPVSPLHFNQFGGNIGGWAYIPKVSTPQNKKIFFFYNYEGTRASRPNGNSYYDTPSAALLSGNFSSAIIPGTSLNGSQYPVGTVFEPGTVKRDASNNIIGGTPYPGNIVPASQFSANGPAFANVLTGALRGGTNLPASPAIPGYVRVPFQDTYVFDKNQNAARVDYNVNAKLSLFFRWVDDSQQESQSYGIFSGNSFPVFPEYRKKPGSSWSANMINVISPTLTNEAIFTYNHLTQVVNVINLQPSQYTESALGFKFQDLFPASNTLNRLPSFNCGSSCQVAPFPPNWVSEGKTFAVTDNLSKVIGSHSLKFGFFWNQNLNGQQPAWTDAPNFNFTSSSLNPNDTGSAIANMLLGNYTTLTQSNGRFYGNFVFHQFEAYVQDSWKVTKNFTLEYGLRWVYPGPTSTYGPFLQYYFDQAAYDPSQAVKLQLTGPFAGSIIPGSGNSANGMVQEGTGALPLGGVEHRYNNLGPRLGFAWDVMGDGKTSIRGGGGIFYERIRQNHNSFDGLGNYPLLYTPTLYGGQVDNVSPSLVSSGIQYTSSIIAQNPNGKIPTIYSWSIGVQRQLPGQVALDVAYVGNAARHLQYTYDLNEVPLGTTTGPNNPLKAVNNVQDAIRPYLGYNSINYTDFGANSNYNALQIRVTRRFGKNFTLNSDFTWSKAMDIVDTDTTNLDFFQNRQFNYGPAGFNRKYVFNVNYVYELPLLKDRNAFVRYTLGGWELTGITRFWSGFPLTIYSGGNQGTLGGTMRADYIGGSTSGNGTWQEYFNPLAFGQPLDGTPGNTGRGILTGPGINNWDFSIFKNLRFGERVSTQLRLETFNVFNHTQFSGVNTTVSASGPGAPVTSATINGLGQVNSTRDPRTVQLGIKLYF
jgi:hypothetical protein